MAKGNNISLRGLDDLFSTEEVRQEAKQEHVQEIPLSELHPFANHPFRVLDDESMQKTVESVKSIGVVNPAIARPRPEGGYELISGHRRCHAAELAGLETLPVLVRDMDDDAATILMVDSNLQRESLLPSERAFAYKMKLEAVRRKAGRPTKNNSDQVGQNLWAVNLVASEADTSKSQVQRFIRLTELLPELLDMVDNKQIAMNPAVELSYLTQEEQTELLDAMEYAQCTPSLSQAQRLKKLSQIGACTSEAMRSTLSEEKKTDMDKVTLGADTLRKYFPKSYTPKQMEETIISLLQQWQKRHDRDNSR